jgi:PAS domain S-box-containing protein
MLTVRRRSTILAVLAILAGSAAAGVVIVSLYHVGMVREGDSLARMVQTQAALSHAVFESHLALAGGDSAVALRETLAHLESALTAIRDLGDFAGLTVSRRAGDTLVVDIKLGVDTALSQDRIVLPSPRMLAAQRAIAGESSAVRGDRDHRGVLVLAALLIVIALLVGRTVSSPLLSEVEEREAAHRALLDHFPGILFLAVAEGDAGWRFEVLDGAVEEITGLPPDHFRASARALLDLVHPEDRPGVEDRWRALASGDEVEGRWDCRLTRPDGSVVWVRARTRRRQRPGSRPASAASVAGVVVDVTAERRALEVRQRAERELSTLVARLPGAAVLVLDAELRILFSGGEVLDRLRAGSGRLKGASLGEVLGDEAMERARATRDVVVRGGQRRYEESCDGSTLLVHASPLEAPDGGVARILVLALDVTEQRQRREDLLASEARFHAFMDASPAVAWIKDAQGRHVYGSQAWERLYGFRDGAWLGLKEHDIAPGDVADAWRAQDGEVLRTGRALSFTDDTVGPDGQPRVWQVVKFPLAGPHGETLVAGMALDVTKERMSETALAASERRLRLALAAGRHGLYDLDLRTGDAVVNDDYVRMIGYDPATFVETNAAWRERLHPEDRDAVYAEYEAYLRGERDVFQVEFRQRTADGGWRWILSLGEIAEWDESGRPTRLVGTHTDIHARRQAEEEVRAHRDELRRWQRVMLDREDRVQALKREVNRLCLRVGEPARYPSQGGAEQP